MAWTNAHGARACPNNPINPVAFFLTCEIDANFLSTVTGRIGFAYWDRVLLYGKGGLAIGEIEAQIRCNTDSRLIAGIAPLNPGCQRKVRPAPRQAGRLAAAQSLPSPTIGQSSQKQAISTLEPTPIHLVSWARQPMSGGLAGSRPSA